jgi:hypothetical protein
MPKQAPVNQKRVEIDVDKVMTSENENEKKPKSVQKQAPASAPKSIQPAIRKPKDSAQKVSEADISTLKPEIEEQGVDSILAATKQF